MRTPTTPAGLTGLDSEHPQRAALRAWEEPGVRPDWHTAAQAEVRRISPTLARHLATGESGAALTLWQYLPPSHRRRIASAMPVLGRALDRPAVR